MSGHTKGRVDVAPFTFSHRPGTADSVSAAQADRRSDLTRIVAAADAAFTASGMRAPRRPWPEPLPTHLALDSVASPTSLKGGTLTVALADDPDAQAQYPVGWNLNEGNLLLYGLVGSGTTTTLSSIALALAAASSPDEIHLYVLDMGAGELKPLVDLPHTAAVITATEQERQRRLVRVLRAELDRRHELGAARRNEPRVVLLIDGFSALRAQYSEPALQWFHDELARIVTEGPALGLLTVISADRGGAVPAALSSTVSQKWLFRLADPYDQALFGVKVRRSTLLAPGRCVVASTGRMIHIGRPAPSVQGAVARVAATASKPRRAPTPLGTLPLSVDPAQLAGALQVDGETWVLPVGIAESSLGPALLPVYAGEHVLIAGPARSGRTGLLRALGVLLTEASPPIELTVVAPRPSLLRDLDGVTHLVTDPGLLPEVLASLAVPDARHVILIDDAETLDDTSGAVDALLKRRLADVRIVAAGRADLLRTSYGHWTQLVRRSGSGVLLRPDVDFDGDLLSVRVPRRAPVGVSTARGWLASSFRG